MLRRALRKAKALVALILGHSVTCHLFSLRLNRSSMKGFVLFGSMDWAVFWNCRLSLQPAPWKGA